MNKRFSFFYGWVIVAVCSLLLVVVFGIRLSFSVFFVALIDEFGWSRADTALIFSTTMIVFMLGSTLAGWALDRIGARTTFTLGALLLGVGLALSSQVSTLTQLAITYGVIAGLGVTILGLSMQASVISRWFRRRRGVAIGIAFAGTGVGSLLVTPLVEWVIARSDWRVAYWVLAGLIVALIPFILLFIRQEPAGMGLRIDGEVGEVEKEKEVKQAGQGWGLAAVLRSPMFWLLMVAGFGTMGPIRLLTVHQLAMMADVGIATAVGARVVGLAGAMTALTFVGSGVLSDRIGRIPTYALGSLCTIAAIILIGLLNSENTQLIWVYAILFGLGEGSRSSLVSAVSSDLFAGSTLGAINGTLGGSFGAGAALLPWLGGVIYDRNGSYQQALLLGIATVLVSATALWLAKRYASKQPFVRS